MSRILAMPPAGGLSTYPAHPFGSWLAVASVVGSLRRGWASWQCLGLSHSGQASSWSEGLATRAGVRVALSFPASLPLHSLKCRGRSSSHRRLCGSVASSTARLVCVETAVCEPLWVEPAASPSHSGGLAHLPHVLRLASATHAGSRTSSLSVCTACRSRDCTLCISRGVYHGSISGCSPGTTLRELC